MLTSVHPETAPFGPGLRFRFSAILGIDPAMPAVAESARALSCRRSRSLYRGTKIYHYL